MRKSRQPLPQNPNWIVIPFLNNWDMTKDAILDSLEQWLYGRRPNIMLVDNGSDPGVSYQAQWWAAAARDLLPDVDILYTAHPHPGVTLNMAWNIALWQIWEFGGEQVLVINNDVRLHPWTFEKLLVCQLQAQALFVTGVGVRLDEFKAATGSLNDQEKGGALWPGNRGGPDFSCFLISKRCHELFPFDPRFTFAGDWDYHTRLRRAGLDSKIFSVNVPYLHIGEGSQTLKRMRETDPERAQLISDTADQHRALYAEKWGGTFGQETLDKPKWEVEV